MADTHINAYFVELADAEKELAVAQGHVNSLKDQIKALTPVVPKVATPKVAKVAKTIPVTETPAPVVETPPAPVVEPTPPAEPATAPVVPASV